MQTKTLTKVFNYILWALIVAVPLVFLKYAVFGFVGPKTALFQALTEILVALWIGLAFADKKYRPRFTLLTIFIFLYLTSLTVSSIFGIDLQNSLWSTVWRGMGLVTLWHAGLLFLAVKSMASAIDWRKLWLFSFGTSALVSLGVPLQVLFFKNLFLADQSSRPGSSFGNATYMGSYLIFNFFIGLWLYFQTKNREHGTENKKIKAALLLGIILNIIAIFWAGTLGVIAAMILGLAILGIYYFFRLPKGQPKKILGVVGIVLILFSGFFFLTRSHDVWKKIPGLSRVATFSFSDRDFQDRLIPWRAGLQGFLEKPILGWGWENYNVVFNKHYDPKLLGNTFDDTFWDKPHNVLVEQFVTGGAIGFLLYVLMFFAIFRELSRFRENGEHSAKPFFIAMLAAYIFQNLLVFDTMGSILMLFLTLAFVDHEYSRSAAKELPAVKQASLGFVAFTALIPAIFLIYFLNVRPLIALGDYYWGINYFLTGH